MTDVTNNGERQVDPDDAHKARYAMAAALIAQEKSGGDVRIIDYGCGTGYGATYFPDAYYVGIDISREAIHYALEHYQREITYENGYARAAQFYGADAVLWATERRVRGGWPRANDFGIAFECLEHFQAPPAVSLRQMLTLTPRIIFSVPYREAKGVNGHHLHHDLTPEDFAVLAPHGDLRFWWMDGAGRRFSEPGGVTLLGYIDGR